LASADPAIELKGVSKRFGATRALDGADLTVSRGEAVALVGSNGAGKTTLLKIIATLILPDQGDVRVAGIPALREPARAKARVGLLVADDRSFYPRLTGRQNLAFFAALWGFSSARFAARLSELSGDLGLSDWLDRPHQECSAGGKQRLALARCLMPGPEILLLDEPTRSLDPAAAAALQETLGRLVLSGATLLFATHSHEEAKRLSDRVLTVEEGRLR